MPDAPGDLLAAADALATQLDATIILSLAQDDYPGSNGLAAVIPERDSMDLPDTYFIGEGAIWSVNTSWDSFLLDFLGFPD